MGQYYFTIKDKRVNSISQYGITWTFDDYYPAGQFIAGDWWVVGPVTVTAISPAPTGSGASRRNGSMINPMPGVSQAYDGRHVDYYESLTVTLPVTLYANQSIVSTISSSETDPPYYSTPDNPIYLYTAAVLTCLSQPPPTDSLRPPYSGSNKPLYRQSQIRADLLPNLAPPASTPTLSSVERWFERPWIDHKIGWSCRRLHPYLNMHDYGREIAADAGNGALMLLLDESVIGDKTVLLTRYVQLGIDLYGIAANGGYWPCDGGQAPGRKYPILFAGLLLSNDEMLNIGTSVRFAEDDQTFYITQDDVDLVHLCELTGVAQSGSANTITLAASHADVNSLNGLTIRLTGGTGAGQERTIQSYVYNSRLVTVTSNWDVQPDNTTTYKVLGYQAADIGVAEWGIRHFESPNKDCPAWDAWYRPLNLGQWRGIALPARVMGLKAAWGHDAFFDYVDRHMQHGENSGSQFQKDMWSLYRSSY